MRDRITSLSLTYQTLGDKRWASVYIGRGTISRYYHNIGEHSRRRVLRVLAGW